MNILTALTRTMVSTVGPLQSRLGRKSLSTIASGFHNAERISVSVGSSGSVHIDLHNLAKVSSSEPLLVYLPPFSTAAPVNDLAQLPRFAQRHATAVIHYRWTEPSFEEESVEDDASNGDEIVLPRFHPGWPAPLHDTLKAYSWIVKNLSPSTYTRRDVYVYGSYLGASLATSLALTETHPHERTAVRGCVAYNGIYNWTMFLPDHPINKLPKLAPRNFLEDILASPGDSDFRDMKQMTSELFNKPDDLFDPFASSCLLFQTPGLLVPPSFHESAIPPPSSLTDLTSIPEEVAEGAIDTLMPLKHPRRSPLVFPPRKSTLKIPEMLLLHDTPPPLPPSLLRRRQRRKKHSFGNSFKTQAEELAGLMRRSINKIELKERMNWDENMDEWNGEADRRVQPRMKSWMCKPTSWTRCATEIWTGPSHLGKWPKRRDMRLATSPRRPGAGRCRDPRYNTHLGRHEKSKTNLQTPANSPKSHYSHDINLTRSQPNTAKMADSVTLRTRKFQRNPLLARKQMVA
ncbi:hypothetical protein O1611_g8959 [Lasiodiplodia mahajangana]|uniref:Uncharacterized protein n=1 Tax=Lasiodiplodia mahajangana TaxID=1108764 RepID=A0ACC2JBC2_9PEZI|nr:hypothetical protein O1611_g8959 [Lasiodiplodia mahajangana]